MTTKPAAENAENPFKKAQDRYEAFQKFRSLRPAQRRVAKRRVQGGESMGSVLKDPKLQPRKVAVRGSKEWRDKYRERWELKPGETREQRNQRNQRISRNRAGEKGIPNPVAGRLREKGEKTRAWIQKKKDRRQERIDKERLEAREEEARKGREASKRKQQAADAETRRAEEQTDRIRERAKRERVERDKRDQERAKTPAAIEFREQMDRETAEKMGEGAMARLRGSRALGRIEQRLGRAVGMGDLANPPQDAFKSVEDYHDWNDAARHLRREQKGRETRREEIMEGLGLREEHPPLRPDQKSEPQDRAAYLQYMETMKDTPEAERNLEFYKKYGYYDDHAKKFYERYIPLGGTLGRGGMRGYLQGDPMGHSVKKEDVFKGLVDKIPEGAVAAGDAFRGKLPYVNELIGPKFTGQPELPPTQETPTAPLQFLSEKGRPYDMPEDIRSGAPSIPGNEYTPLSYRKWLARRRHALQTKMGEYRPPLKEGTDPGWPEHEPRATYPNPWTDPWKQGYRNIRRFLGDAGRGMGF